MLHPIEVDPKDQHRPADQGEGPHRLAQSGKVEDQPDQNDRHRGNCQAQGQEGAGCIDLSTHQPTGAQKRDFHITPEKQDYGTQGADMHRDINHVSLIR